jgi:hypothetical protein
LEILGRDDEALAAYEEAVRLDPTAPMARNARDEMLKHIQQARLTFWVVRIGPRDRDAHGNYHSMEKFAGPFSSKEEASKEASKNRSSQREQLDDLRRYDDDLAKQFGPTLLGIDYVVRTEAELEEARQRGIRIY